MKQTTYCEACMLHKPACEFKAWAESDFKSARRCDKCKSNAKDPQCPEFAEKVKCKKLMLAETHARLTPVQKNYATSKPAKASLKTRRSIEDIKQARALNITVEQLRGE